VCYRPLTKTVARCSARGRPAGATGCSGRFAQNGYVRLTDFWERMRRSFGESYADSLARDHVLAALQGRTVEQALSDGVDAKMVWRAVCSEFEVPARER